MPLCDFDRSDAVMGSTSLGNMFIMEYMPQAPSDYVKVYLYGLLLCRYPGLCDSLEQMSGMLHLDMNTVKNAFAYWEREGAVIRLSDNPPSYSFVMLSPGQGKHDMLDDDVYSNRDYIRTLQSLMPSLVMENHEIRIANDWLDVFGLNKDSVYYLVKKEVERRGERLPSARTMFKHLNDTVKKWAEAGVHDVKTAQEFTARESKYFTTAQAIVERFNQRRLPTADEVDLVTRWIEQYHYQPEDVLTACGELTKAERPSFKYLDSILQNRLNNPDEGLHEQVKTLNSQLGISLVPTPAQAEALRGFYAMGFEFDAIRQAAKQCGLINKREYGYIERTLQKWKDAGVFTLQDIEKERESRTRDAVFMAKILESAGADRKVTEADIKSLRVWKALIEDDALLYAAEQAHGTENPVKYIDKIVKNWSARRITTLEKARTETLAVKESTAPVRNNPSKILNERDIRDEDYANWFSVQLKHGKKAEE